MLVIGQDGDVLLALGLTSKDHDRDEDQERRSGREWMDIGTGAWDAQRRPSEVRLNRLLRLDHPACAARVPGCHARCSRPWSLPHALFSLVVRVNVRCVTPLGRA